MIARRLRAGLVIAALSIVTLSVPARAQWIVFDPTNYAQNILTAARELQQVNNEIQMLENQATSLINQARNLASLPYSSLATLEQSIAQTQQLLIQAQRIAYSVSTIDEAFTQQYPQAYSSGTSSQQLLTDAQSRWQNARAGFQDTMRVQAGVVQNLDSTRTQIDALMMASQGATGAPKLRSPAISSSPSRPSSSPTSPPSWPRSRAPRAWTPLANSRPRLRRKRRCRTSSTMARAISPATRRCSINARPFPQSPRHCARRRLRPGRYRNYRRHAALP
jgi:P-type conjugative transfer protein TrbJ